MRANVVAIDWSLLIYNARSSRRGPDSVGKWRSPTEATDQFQTAGRVTQSTHSSVGGASNASFRRRT